MRGTVASSVVRSGRRLLMRVLMIAAAIVLTGCQTVKPAVIPHVVTQTVMRYVSVPSALTEPCSIAKPTKRTVGEVVEIANARRQSLIRCNDQLDAIRKLGDKP